MSDYNPSTASEVPAEGRRAEGGSESRSSLRSERAPKARAHIFISGRVQGVFFRQNTKNKAKELGITGWVKNLPDGRVEALFEGEKDKVEDLIKWTKKGPVISRVDASDINWAEYQGEFNDFEIRYD